MPRKRINPNVKLPSVEDVAHIPYDPETGVFMSLKTGKPLQLPKNPKKYLTITALGWVYSAHRIAFLKVHGWCPDNVDHADRNRHNNAISNLRPATPPENIHNQERDNTGCSSKYTGVQARGKEGRETYGAKAGDCDLGTFYTEEEAAYAYNQKVVELYGKFARLNELPERVEIKPLTNNAKLGFRGVTRRSDRKDPSPRVYLGNKYIGSFDSDMEAALEFDLAAQRAGWHPREYNFPAKSLPLKFLVENFKGMHIKNKRKRVGV